MTTAVITMTDNESTIVTDCRFPRWRARLVHDEHAGEPDGDALAPALLVPRHSRPRFAAGVYVPVHAAQMLAAWSHLSDRDLFCRYLRIYHGASTVAVANTAEVDVIVFDTADFRRHVGITTPPVDLSGEKAEWQAWLDGDVYGVVVERHRTGTITWDDNTTTATSQWREVDSMWGLFGHEYAHQEALDLLHDHAAG
jgi:hypothetical protein